MSVPTIWGLHHSGGLPLVEHGIIVIGWVDAGDLSGLPNDRDAFKELLRERFPGKTENWVANAAGQLLRFRHVMAVGDLVVYPRKGDRTINIGRIAGDYAYDPQRSERYPNRRKVEWIKTELPRDGFTQGCLYEFGSALSVFQVSTHASEVLAVVGSPGAPNLPVVAPELAGPTAPPSEGEPSATQIEELTADFILRSFKTELKGHPFAQFCGRLLEALGYTTRVSPPGADQGIDIVASEDALGVTPPLLKVQCKSSNSASTSEQVQALNGALGPTDIGLFIAVAGFTTPAKQVAAGMPRMRLIGPAELVQLVVDHYDALPDEAKTDLPLRRVWMPDRPSAEE